MCWVGPDPDRHVLELQWKTVAYSVLPITPGAMRTDVQRTDGGDQTKGASRAFAGTRTRFASRL